VSAGAVAGLRLRRRGDRARRQCDLVGVAALGRVLACLGTAEGGALVVDMAGVEYVDHRLLLTLDAYARGNGIAVSLWSAPPFVARLMELRPVFRCSWHSRGAQG
jgi:STAS domain